MARLGKRVLHESIVWFVGLGYAQIGLRDALDAKRREQRAQFGELARIAAGEHDPVHDRDR